MLTLALLLHFFSPLSCFIKQTLADIEVKDSRSHRFLKSGIKLSKCADHALLIAAYAREPTRFGFVAKPYLPLVPRIPIIEVDQVQISGKGRASEKPLRHCYPSGTRQLTV